jgi:hypothetical protein
MFIPLHGQGKIKACCGPVSNPRIVTPDSSLRSGATRVSRPAQGCKRRLISVHTELLFALPASCAPATDHRQRNEPSRFPLHFTSCGDATMTDRAHGRGFPDQNNIDVLGATMIDARHRCRSHANLCAPNYRSSNCFCRVVFQTSPQDKLANGSLPANRV